MRLRGMAQDGVELLEKVVRHGAPGTIRRCSVQVPRRALLNLEDLGADGAGWWGVEGIMDGDGEASAWELVVGRKHNIKKHIIVNGPNAPASKSPLDGPWSCRCTLGVGFCGSVCLYVCVYAYACVCVVYVCMCVCVRMGVYVRMCVYVCVVPRHIAQHQPLTLCL